MTRQRYPIAWPAAVAVLFSLSAAFAQTVQSTPPPEPIPSTYFGMHIHEPLTTTRLPGIPFRTWRLWDTSVNWPDIELSKGNFRWARLDSCVALAEKNNWQIVMPLGFTPTWASARPGEDIFGDGQHRGWSAEPRDIQDWRDYVRAIATRYKGRIHIWEIWNEPNNRIFFSGTLSAFMPIAREAYAILKDIDPTNTVISPAAADNGGTGATWLGQFLQAGGGAYADVIGHHFYVEGNPPEVIPTRVRNVQRVLTQYGQQNKPLWNTESTWSIDYIGFPVVDDAVGYLARGYILNWASGVRMFNWYAWDDRFYPSIYMVENDLHTMTPAAKAYAEMENWLIGSRMFNCQSDAGSNWVCGLQRPDGTGAYIVWNTTGAVTLQLPPEWHARNLRDLKGATQPAPSSGAFQAGKVPILIESDYPNVAVSSKVQLVSAASYKSGPVAPDSIVSVFGDGLATGEAAATAQPLLETLAGSVASVKDSRGVQRLALLFYASPAQINLLVPSDSAPGSATLTITRSDGINVALPFTIAPVVPGVFSANNDGQGIAAGFSVRADSSGQQTMKLLYRCDTPGNRCVADPIDLGANTDQTVLVLYGTGLRGRSSLNAIQATYCGASLPVLYGGPQGNYAGLDQVNLALPASIRGCGESAVQLTVDGQPANAVTIAVQ